MENIAADFLRIFDFVCLQLCLTLMRPTARGAMILREEKFNF